VDADTLHKQEQMTEKPQQGGQSRAQITVRAALAVMRFSSISLLAGLLGSLAAILVMGVLRLTVGTPTLPELLGDRILATLTANQFVALLVRFAPNSKTTPLGLILLGQFIVGILLGPAFALAAGKALRVSGFWPGRRAWIAAVVFALAMEGIGLALFWPVIGQGLVGDPVDRARLLTALSMLATFVSFVAVMLLAGHWLYRAWTTQPETHQQVIAPLSPLSPVEGEPAPAPAEIPAASERGISRRTALQAAGVVIVAVAAGGFGVNRLIASYLARSNLAYEGMSNPSLAPITPIEDFYVVSQNVLDPQVDLGRWRLEVTGLVRQEQSWTYAQILALPSETRAVTLECIANGVGHRLMSTAEWKGVLLKTVLDEAGGVEPNGKYIIYTSVDGYQYSLPLADLLEAWALLAWQMNGEPLPERHGFPLRAVTPGRYGEQSPKWLTRIEVVDQPYNGGLYQSQGWSSAQVETTSRIDTPSGQAKLGLVTVAGIAFSGIRGIQKVEVSADDGVTWHTAKLLPPLSDQSWVFWNWTWTPPGRGTYTLVVRATDDTGALQTETQRGTVPSGATGWHHATIHIV
jgi:DMSO/TMAO reductase YedYZ molybdopterin-dependent catalytic subunit